MRSRVLNRFQARLRIWRGGDYVQFVTAVALGRVEELPDVNTNAFWGRSVGSPASLRRRRCGWGITPFRDLLTAFELHPDVEMAIRPARRGLRNGETSVVWGVAGVDEASGSVAAWCVMRVTMGTTNRCRVVLDQIAWVEVTDVAV